MYPINKGRNSTREILIRSNNFGRFNYLNCLMMIIAILQVGCKKFVEVDIPPNVIAESNVFSNDRTAATVLTGIYSNMGVGINSDIAKYTGLLSDEFTLWPGADFDLVGYYSNSLSSNENRSTGNEVWIAHYNYIFNCNAAIDGLTASSSVTPKVKKQLLGEAHFLRAWFYYYLVNLYGDIPIALGTDPAINTKLARSSKQSVYELIISDLINAQELLSQEYLNGQLAPYTDFPERVRPTTWAASALLARVYLFTGQYSKAELEANKVIGNASYFELLPYKDIFLKNSREAIWQLQPTDVGWNTREGRIFNLSASPVGLSSSKPLHLSNFLLSSFELNDQRRSQWVGSFIIGGVVYYFPFKYKIGARNTSVTSPSTLTEYSMMLRLGEQYLIRAEARVRQNNISGAIADLNMIRNRANLPLIATTNMGISQVALIDAILHERQVELFTECGHRWFDLKRSGKVDEVMQVVTPDKGGVWTSTDQLLPVPYGELLYGPNLTQNPGY